MRAFKKIMAGAIATAIAATMATSAFAASFDAGKVGFAIKDAEGNVTAYDYNAVGQTTVLVVPADVWVNNAIDGLEDSDILYINQYEDAATANTAIAAGFGVKLNDKGTLADGDYYALFGGNTGANGAFAITAVAFNVTTTPDEPVVTIMYGDIDGNSTLNIDDAITLIKKLGGATLEVFNEAAADVDDNATINIDDAIMIIKKLGGADITLGPKA